MSDVISDGMWHCQRWICVLLGSSAIWCGTCHDCCDFVHIDSKNPSTKQGRTQGVGEAAGLHPPPINHLKLKIKKHRFCRYYGIKSFTWFSLQLKSATEIRWWLVHNKIIFKIKQKLYRASGSAILPQGKTVGVHLAQTAKNMPGEGQEKDTQKWAWERYTIMLLAVTTGMPSIRFLTLWVLESAAEGCIGGDSKGCYIASLCI
jgi:hypothetical protein